MLKLSAICVGLVSLLGTCAAHAEAVAPAAPLASAQPAAPLAAHIDALLQGWYQADAPGATVIVVKDGNTVLRKAYGLADTATKQALQPEMTLRLGSVTKQFTAAAILLLAEEGKLALTDEITRFFPDYPTHGEKITVEHLLTHTSGIVSYTNKPQYVAGMHRDLTVAEMIASFKNDPLEFKPGSTYRYNNSGYFLLGAMIEKVSGQPYAQFVAERIFTPLGMTHTAYEGHERLAGPRALGHTKVEHGYGPSSGVSMTQPYAAGALVSTVDDLARWDAAISAGKLLKPASWQRALSAYTLTNGKASGYGYGWEVGTLQGLTAHDHGGAINGFRSYVLRLPQQHVYVAVLSNSDAGVMNPGVVATRLAALAADKPFPEFKEVKLDAATLERHAGVYTIDATSTRTFWREGDALMMQRTGRAPIRLAASSATGFFLPDALDHFTFVVDAQGKTSAVTVHQSGQQLQQPRVGDAPLPRAVVKLDAASFDRRVGAYELAPNFVLTLSRDGERYFAQATGQGKLEIFPANDSVFFARAVAAEVRFDGLDSSYLVLHQNGQQIRAKRL